MNLSERYVRFVEVGRSNRVRTSKDMVAVAKTPKERDLVYEAECEVGQDGRKTGMLCVRGLDFPGHGLSLAGIFRPLDKGRRVWDGIVQVKGAYLERKLNCTMSVGPCGGYCFFDGWTIPIAGQGVTQLPMRIADSVIVLV